MVNFIVWLIIGGFIGWVASMIMRTDGQQGLLLNIVVGVVGAFVAGMFLAPLFGVPVINESFSIAAMLLSLGGAVILLYLLRLLSPRSTFPHSTAPKPVSSNRRKSNSQISSSKAPSVQTAPSQEPSVQITPPQAPSMPSLLAYLDFEIDVYADDVTGGYTVAVVNSPEGQVRASVSLPFGELELKNRLLALQNALLRSGGPRRRGPTEHEQTVQSFGRELFDFLLPGEVRSLYRSSRGKAVTAGEGLRLKLRIQDPALAALPWEFLFDSVHDEYICLSTQTPLVRYLELAQPPRPLSVTPPLRILGMIASPEGVEKLDVALEKQRVEQALARLVDEGLVELHWLAGQTRQDLQRAMRRGPWHIFHYIGHGGFDPQHNEGLLILADANGQAEPINARQLGTLLTDHASLRMVFLNACEGAASSQQDLFSSTAATLMRRGIPAVLAMQYTITDRAAIEFTAVFYESLADGYPMDAAVTEARKAVSMAVNHSVEWGTPVLHMRTPDGVVFAVEEGKRQR